MGNCIFQLSIVVGENGTSTLKKRKEKVLGEFFWKKETKSEAAFKQERTRTAHVASVFPSFLLLFSWIFFFKRGKGEYYLWVNYHWESERFPAGREGWVKSFFFQQINEKLSPIVDISPVVPLSCKKIKQPLIINGKSRKKRVKITKTLYQIRRGKKRG